MNFLRCFFLVVLTAASAQATITVSLNSLTGVPANHNLIASDPARDDIPVVANIGFASLLGLNEGDSYRVRCYLLDNSGAQIPLTAGSFVEQAYSVAFPVGTIFTGLSYSTSNTFNFSLKPSTRLLPGKTYRARVTIERDDSGSWTLIDTFTQATSQIVWHFPSTNPNDASPNIAVRVQQCEFASNYIIRSQNDDFSADISGIVRRYDNYDNTSPGIGFISIPFQWTLRNLSNNTDVPLVSTAGSVPVAIAEFVAGSPKTPAQASFNGTLHVEPQNWADIDPLAAYELRLKAGHPGESLFTEDSSITSSPDNMLALTGTLRFGTFVTTFDLLASNPHSSMGPSADVNAHAEGSLNIAFQHGKIPGFPTHTFSGNLPVKIMLNGDAEFIGVTPINVSAPSSDITVYGGTQVTRTDLQLGPGGATSNLSVKLPRGLGYTLTPGSRVLKTKLTASNATLNSSLSVSVVSVSGPVYITLERLPLVFTAPSFVFNFTDTRFRCTPSSCLFEQALELAVLEGYGVANQLDWPNGKPLHMGNDQVFRSAHVSGTDSIVVSTASDGSAYVNDARVLFNAGAWWTHFPSAWLVSTSGGDVANSEFILHNNIVSTSSTLNGISAVVGYYEPDPKPESGANCPLGLPDSGYRGFFANSQTGIMNFTADGSLAGTVTLYEVGNSPPPLTDLYWGTFATSPAVLFAHQLAFSGSTGMTATMMLPAHCLPHRDIGTQTGLEAPNRAAAAHLTGRNGASFEYPQTDGYTVGATHYAGLNIRPAQNTSGGSLQGVVRMGGGLPFSYNLHNDSKFCLRNSGMTGILQSTQDISLIVSDMQMDFDGMKLGFLDNHVVSSRLDGTLTAGGPSPSHACQLDLSFQSLFLHDNGALDKSDLAPNQPDQHLAYWNTDITPLAMQFMQPDPCSGPTETILGLSVSTTLPALTGTQKLQGLFGFRPDTGALVSKADSGATGIDSRLKVPGNIKLAGPGGSSYDLSPVCGAYLNAWPGSGSTGGFGCIAGLIDVPFFDGLPAHVHAKKTSVTTVYVMGPQASNDAGPFTKASFDEGNLGTPVGVSVTDYRDNYPLNAHRSWMGLIDFDYPVFFDRGPRTFTSHDPITADLKLLNASSSVRSLTPSTADIGFKAQVNNSLNLSPAGLMGEAVNLVAGGVLDTIDSQFDVPLIKPVMTALNTFEQVLADGPKALIRPPLVSAIEDLLPGQTMPNPTTLINTLSTNLAATFDDVPTLPSGWRNQVSTRLDDAHSIVVNLKTVTDHADDLLDAAKAIAGIAGNGIEVPADVTQTLARAKEALTAIDSRISQVRTALAGLSLGMNATEWHALLDQALPTIPQLPLVGLSAHDQAELIADAMLNYLLGDAQICSISEDMREQVSAFSTDLHNSTDTIIGTMSDMISSTAGAAVPSPLPGFKTGKLEGYARINGDSLHELRLDLDIELDTGSDTKFHGYALYRDLTSDTPTNACRTASGVTAELTLGAQTEFEMGAPASPTSLEIEAKFGFDDTGGLNGLAGRFGIASDEGITLGAVKINQAELGFAFGIGGSLSEPMYDYYLYGKGAGKSDLLDIEAAVYVGVACDPTEVLGRIDPVVSELFEHGSTQAFFASTNPNPVYGLYAFGYGAISLNSLIGIPPSCMLNIKAGMGSGMFGFYRKLPNDNFDLLFGLRNDIGASGEVLCIADISARLSVIGAATIPNLSGLTDIPSHLGDATIDGIGKASVSAEVGVDPFSYTFEKTLTVNFSYNPNASPKTSWNLDL